MQNQDEAQKSTNKARDDIEKRIDTLREVSADTRIRIARCTNEDEFLALHKALELCSAQLVIMRNFVQVYNILEDVETLGKEDVCKRSKIKRSLNACQDHMALVKLAVDDAVRK